MYATDLEVRSREFGRIYPASEAWLAKQAFEEVLEPDLPIVDPHYHFIEQPGFRYLKEQFEADLQSGHRVAQTVYVEMPRHYRKSGPNSLRPVGETEHAAFESASSPVIASGIVGYADLTLGAEVEEALAAHVQAGAGRFKGVRYATPRDPHPAIVVHHHTPLGVTDSAQFDEGVRALGRAGLTLDAYVFFHQLDELTRIAQRHPHVTIVIGHCGGLLGYGPYAGRHQEVFAEWRQKLAALAECPNVRIKLGGVLMRLASYDYLNVERPEPSSKLAACLRPYVETCIELFEPQRCMFESNFPVDKIATGYRTLWNAFKRITANATPSEKTALYSQTARETYRLPKAISSR